MYHIYKIYIYIYHTYIYISYIYRYRSNISTRCSLIMCWVVRATDQELGARGLLTGNHASHVYLFPSIRCIHLSIHHSSSIHLSFHALHVLIYRYIHIIHSISICTTIHRIGWREILQETSIVESHGVRRRFPPFSIPKPLNFLYNISPCFLAKSV